MSENCVRPFFNQYITVGANNLYKKRAKWGQSKNVQKIRPTDKKLRAKQPSVMRPGNTALHGFMVQPDKQKYECIHASFMHDVHNTSEWHGRIGGWERAETESDISYKVNVLLMCQSEELVSYCSEDVRLVEGGMKESAMMCDYFHFSHKSVDWVRRGWAVVRRKVKELRKWRWNPSFGTNSHSERGSVNRFVLWNAWCFLTGSFGHNLISFV